MGVRFAPSPTGSFHVGNLRTAWISQKWANALKLPWVVRFEDIDEPRRVPGAQDSQLADMRALHLVPDEVVVQSALRGRHWELFEQAKRVEKIYWCDCSRKDILEALERSASAPHAEPPLYNGHCRTLPPDRRPHRDRASLAWRFTNEDPSGHLDFIVARTAPSLSAGESTFAPAYHWACAIDDFDGNYELLVRAWDLAPALAQQRAIQRWLTEFEGRPFAAASVFHCALVTRDDGGRLEKRTLGMTLAELNSLGCSAKQLEILFEQSFVFNLRPVPRGTVFGEVKPTLPVTELGLPHQNLKQ